MVPLACYLGHPSSLGGIRLFALLAPLLWTSLLLAFPERTGWVTDGAGVLTSGERQALHRELDAFEKQTGFEVAVVVVRSLEGKSVEDYSFELAKSWKVGKAGKDNGVVLLLAMAERKSRIETGKGVGHLLTDVESADILDRVLRPRMKAGKVADALAESTRAIQKELSGATSPGASPPRPASSPARSVRDARGGSPLPRLLAFGAGGGLCFGALLAYRRRQRRLLLAQQREVAEAQQQALEKLPTPDMLFARFSAGLPFPLDRSIFGDYSGALLAAQQSLLEFRESRFSSHIIFNRQEEQLTRAVRRASQAIRNLENKIAEWRSYNTEAPQRIKALREELTALESISQEGNLAWKEFSRTYPGEDAGTNPDALVFEARARVTQLSAMTTLSSVDRIEAFLQAEKAARGALLAARAAIEQTRRLPEERAQRWRDAQAAHDRVQAKVNSQRLLSVGNGRNPLADQGENLFREGKTELDRGVLCNTRKALDLFTRADPMLDYVEPVVSNYSSYSGGGVDSSYTSSSYDSGSSYSGYDSGSSSGYDSGSSSSYDSGSSGGGDYGGGGASSDW
jgi:uncharacterized protein